MARTRLLKVEVISELSPEQRAAIEHLAQGGSKKSAAEAANVDERTIYRWRQQGQFAAELDRRKDELQDEEYTLAQSSRLYALGLLRRVMQDGTPYEQMRAAEVVLRSSPRLEIVDRKGRTPPTVLMGDAEDNLRRLAERVFMSRPGQKRRERKHKQPKSSNDPKTVA